MTSALPGSLLWGPAGRINHLIECQVGVSCSEQMLQYVCAEIGPTCSRVGTRDHWRTAVLEVRYQCACEAFTRHRRCR
jgi:hypothetical protein